MLPTIQFEQGLNILNFAIENERINIVVHLDMITKGYPDVRRELIEHKFRKDQITALHQVMSLGNRTLIHLILKNFNADIDSLTHK